MGKRKYYDADEEEYLDRKIRKLERKKLKIRRKHRHRSYSLTSSSSSRSRDREYVNYVEDDRIDRDEQTWQEDSRNEESQFGDEIVIDLVNAPKGLAAGAAATPANAVGLKSVVAQPHTSESAPPFSAPAPPPLPVPAPVLTPTSAPSPAPAPTSALTPETADPCMDSFAPSTSAQLIPELEPDILCLLGDEPVEDEKFGPCVQKDVACRWSDILVNGLKEEIKKDIVKHYEIPENLKLATAPILNPEIKAACNENFLKRDNILVDKQKLLATVITAVGNTISMLFKTDSKEEDFKNQLLRSLSDTGRLLCHLHFSETQTRRNFLLTVLSKDVRDNIKDQKRDNSLFGQDLQENLKSMKAITKTGAELKPPVAAAKPKFPPRSRQAEPSTSRALNWRGQPPAAAPAQPRRTYPRTNSTRGGRRPPPPRRASDRRAPPSHSRSWRR